MNSDYQYMLEEWWYENNDLVISNELKFETFTSDDDFMVYNENKDYEEKEVICRQYNPLIESSNKITSDQLKQHSRFESELRNEFYSNNYKSKSNFPNDDSVICKSAIRSFKKYYLDLFKEWNKKLMRKRFVNWKCQEILIASESLCRKNLKIIIYY